MDALAYAAGALLIAWGVSHIAPTQSVAESFGSISVDNRRIFVMEWVAEGFTHIFLGALAILVTAVEGASAAGTELVYVATAAVLVLLAGWTVTTGARTPVVWFRICPVVLGSAAALLVAAALL